MSALRASKTYQDHLDHALTGMATQCRLFEPLIATKALQRRVARRVIDDCLNVTFEWRAGDAMGLE